ncbi:MAG TPA: helicase HerA-like domain-containing protein [Thermoplasmata archaeon]|nr:helicase HerA-like domain-containing protein [Thermoplasmata archaeon]
MPLHLGANPDSGETIRLPEEDLLRHAVILGATGSGKTVLAKAILEEAVRAGIPVIAVDSQGDLASLGLAPTQDSVALHPAPQDIVDGYWSRAAVSILTPGSSKGSAASLNPLKAPPAFESSEEAVLFLDALAESLAGAMGYEPSHDGGSRAKDAIYLTLQDAWKAGRWPADVDALSRLLERDPALEGGRLLSKRERASLVRRAKSMTVGAKGLLFTTGAPLDVASMLSWAPTGRVPVNIVYTGGQRNTVERDLVVATLCEDIYHWMTSEPSGDLRLVLYIDEVAGLCPPHPKNPPAKKFLSLLFRQARKYGVGLIVATQNVTDLDYKALGQANTWALGRLLAKQDLDRVRHLVASLHPSAPDAVMEQIPSLRPGQFVLLSPDHLGEARRLEVRGLATQHVVVPEEKFREIQSSHALVSPREEEDARTARRRKLATAAAKAARTSLKAEVEEGVGFRVLKIFEDVPGMYGPEEVVAMTGIDARFITILLRKLADARLLRTEHVDARDVYWDPTVGFDPRRGVPARAATLPLRYPLVQATKRVREHLERRMLVIPKERLSRKEFYYLPLWRVEGELPLGRKGGRVARQFYVSAVSGEIAHAVNGSLSFEQFPRKDGSHVEPLAPKSHLESGPTQKVGDPVPLAKVGPSQALEIVRRSFGAKVLTDHPELCLLPVWKFHIESTEDRRTRPLWVDGTLGTVLRGPPEGL